MGIAVGIVALQAAMIGHYILLESVPQRALMGISAIGLLGYGFTAYLPALIIGVGLFVYLTVVQLLGRRSAASQALVEASYSDKT